MEHKRMQRGQLKNAQTGEIECVFATLNRVDRDNDVISPSAFTPGQSVPLCWSHDWSRVCGKGTVRLEQDRAIFAGKLFLGTHEGREAHATLAGLGSLAEFSYGFTATDWKYTEVDGREVRRIDKLELVEVSPVIAAASYGTQLLSLKRGDRRRFTPGQLRRRHVARARRLTTHELERQGISAEIASSTRRRRIRRQADLIAGGR
jgi:HK97 family phage prohead protease